MSTGGNGARKTHNSLRDIFAIPIVLGLLTTIGLVAALVGDGIWDGVSWITLGVLVVVYAFYWLRRQ